MKDILVSTDDIKKLAPFLNSNLGKRFVNPLIKITGIDIANNLYDKSKHLKGANFCTDLLSNIGVKRIVRNIEVIDKYKETPFITISNHPYGHIDGMSIIEAISSVNPNYKVLVNLILGIIDCLQDNFILVNPFKKESEKNNSNLNGIRGCIRHLEEGNPLGLFPAGAISNIYISGFKTKIEDRKWQDSIIRFIKKSESPIIPVHISGRNSYLFYYLRIFGMNPRLVRLCHEFMNKKGKNIVLTFGEPIAPSTIRKYNNISELALFLKNKTYELGCR